MQLDASALLQVEVACQINSLFENGVHAIAPIVDKEIPAGRY